MSTKMLMIAGESERGWAVVAGGRPGKLGGGSPVSRSRCVFSAVDFPLAPRLRQSESDVSSRLIYRFLLFWGFAPLDLLLFSLSPQFLTQRDWRVHHFLRQPANL